MKLSGPSQHVDCLPSGALLDPDQSCGFHTSMKRENQSHVRNFKYKLLPSFSLDLLQTRCTSSPLKSTYHKVTFMSICTG